MDIYELERKKEYELKVIDLLIGRCYPLEDISDLRKKTIIFNEAEVFYRDHIKGSIDSDASHHDIEKRFPNLNLKIRAELSQFAEKMMNANDKIDEIEKIIKEYGINVSFSSDKLKKLLKNF